MLMIPNGLGSGMSKNGSITMQKARRVEIITACTKGEMKPAVAAALLQVTTRQIRRLQKQLAEGGPAALTLDRRGKPSNHQLDPEVARTALQLVREHYADFGPTLACEQLRDRHRVILSKETLRRLMIEAGLWTPKGVRRAALHQPRERRPCRGELVQIDGSRHDWFERRRDACTLLVFIDDATGQLLQLHFAESETTASYFEALRGYIAQHGKPQAYYSDRAAVFRSPSATSDTCTQFQRALDQLGIELICANSPQAKGRVERANRTLQDRLVKQMRLDGISDIDAANRWCVKYIEQYNAQFAFTPASELDLHTSLHADIDLKLILTCREVRKLTTKLTLKHGSKMYLLKDTAQARSLIGQPIAIHTYSDGRIELRANDQVFAYTTLEQPTRQKMIDVDTKTLHPVLDKRRNRPERNNRTPAMNTQGVSMARKASAQIRL